MIIVGKKQVLSVANEDQSGYYLHCADDREVFLPGTLSGGNIKIGDQVEVFVYLDGEGNELATAKLPSVEVGDFACLKVMSVTPHGAFLDMGIPKDLLVPRKLQKYEMKVGEIHLVKILLEESTNRIYGTSKIGDYVTTSAIPLRRAQAAKVIPYHRTPLGYKILVDNKYLGMVYHNEIYIDVTIGQEYSGTVKSVRADGQVDALLQEVGRKHVDANSDKILRKLKEAGGRLNLSDKTDPIEIDNTLGMSKKTFKKAIGMLFKQRKINLEATYIELIEKNS